VRPRTFDSVLYCNACQAIVRESLKKLKTSRSEVDVRNQSYFHYCSSQDC